MGKYVRAVEFTTQFQGDTVRVVMEPLNREAYMKLATPVTDLKTEDSERLRNLRLFTIAVETLSTHLRSIDGLTDAAGVAINKEEVLDKVFFLELVNAMFGALMESASLGKATSAA